MTTAKHDGLDELRERSRDLARRIADAQAGLLPETGPVPRDGGPRRRGPFDFYLVQDETHGIDLSFLH